MGKVIAELHVMPIDVNVDFNQVIEKIKEVMPASADFKDSKIEPIAFGLKKAILSIL